MVYDFFDFLLDLPLYVMELVKWCTEPISPKYFNVSPLELFALGGSTLLVFLITWHVIRLFLI